MGQYYQRDLSSSTTWQQGSNAAGVSRHTLEETTASAGDVSGTRDFQTGSYASIVTFTTPSGGVGQTSSQQISAQLDVTAAGSSLSYKIGLHVVSSDGTTSPSGVQGASTFTGTGLKSDGPYGLGFSDSSQRLGLSLLAINADMMTNQSITLRVNTADSYVTVPWDVGAPPAAAPLDPLGMSGFFGG